MEFRSDEPGARSIGTPTEPASPTTVELDLYDELSSFSALSPEQQRKELERVALLREAQASPPARAEEQGKELESVALPQAAQPSPASEKSAPASFDFIEQSNLALGYGPSSNPSAVPAFDLVDGSLFEPPDLPDPPAAQPTYAFVEQSPPESSPESPPESPPETAREISQSSDDGLIASESPDTLGRTSPLADIFSGAIVTQEGAMRCELCGARSTAEDLFCPSCGELLGDLDL